MTENRNFYMSAGPGLKDWLLQCHENNDRPFDIKNKLKGIVKSNVSVNDIREAIVMSYIDSGESAKAVDLACHFNEQEPRENMHNLVLKGLLSSWQFTQQIFLDESLAWARKWGGEANVTLRPYQHERPRVGFVCDYGSTVFGENAIFPMCAAFSRMGLDVYYYNFEVAKYSVVNGDIRVANIHHLSSEKLSKLIMNDKIDVLIDLNGRLRENHRLQVFARRSAPIQLNYFNLVGTTGMKCYDYAIVDEMQVPKQDEKYFTEKLLRLPCGVNGAFAFKRDVPIEDRSHDSSRPFIFASTNAFFKCNDLLLRTWAEILRRVPRSRLLIKCHETNRDRVIRKIAHVFSREGVDFERILIEGWSSLQKLRKQYAHVDLCLDTFPYSGGSSTLNALWQAVPVLTWCGDGWRARSTASMLVAAGIPECIVGSREEYVEMAVRFATGGTFLEDCRRHLKAHMNDNHYFKPDVVYTELAQVISGLVKRAGVPMAEL